MQAKLATTVVILSTATALAIALLAPSARAAQTTAPAGDAGKGKKTFERVGCWQCHGHQGQGGREGPRIASPVPMAWPVFSNFVRTTRRNMPPYTETVLPNEELGDIYAYLRSVPPALDYTTISLLNGMVTTAPGPR